MKQEQFESLIRSLEVSAAAEPGAYRAKLVGLASLGYAYIGGILALLFAAVGLLIWGLAGHANAGLVKVTWILLVLIWAVLRALWVRFEPPQGRAIVRSEAPALFALIDAVRDQAQAPPVHEVLVTQEFNAAIVQHPRFGILGWPKNYLILGLPLMQALTPSEFKAVVAHELGHLSGAHGKFGAWIYRLRASWSQLHQALTEQDHWGSFLFVPFFKWFAPRFAAYSFVQARQQEYEADRMAATVTDARTASSALLRLELQSDYVEGDYWRNVFKRVTTEPHPLATPYRELQPSLTIAREGPAQARVLDAALKVKTGYRDTHPSLADRLAALACPAFTPTPMEASAANKVLGTLEGSLADHFDREWQQGVEAWWRKRHEEVAKSRERLAELSGAVDRELTVDERWEHAQLTEELESEDLALARYERLMNDAPDHAPSRTAYGRMLLARDDDRGIEQLQRAAQLNPVQVHSILELIVLYLQRHGRVEEAKPFLEQYHAAVDVLEAAREERASVRMNDTFLSHGLTDDQLTALTRKLAKFDAVQRAYLVQKRVVHFLDSPVYVLGVKLRSVWWRSGREAREAALVEQIVQSMDSDREMFVVSLGSANRAFSPKLEAVPGSLVFEKR